MHIHAQQTVASKRTNATPAPLSVVIPCYRSQATIARAIDSVFNQSWRAAELIIVDDCSPDDAHEFVTRLSESYPENWIKIFRRKINGGPGLARNDGWNVAQENYVAFLDADDTWHPAKTKLQLSYMLHNQEVDMTSTRRVLFAQDTLQAELNVRELSFTNMLWRNQAAISGTILKRALPQRFPNHRRLCEDYSLWLSALAENCKARLLDAPLAFAHKAAYGESGLSAQLWSMQRNELGVFSDLWRLKKMSLPVYVSCSAFSLTKYAYRVLTSKVLPRR